MVEELEPQEKREQQLRQEYGWLHDRLVEIFFLHDPARLAALGAPDDEYSVEVDEFLSHLKEIRTPIALSQVLYEAFVRMFDEKMMLPRRASFESLAEDVWKAYQDWQNEHA